MDRVDTLVLEADDNSGKQYISIYTVQRSKDVVRMRAT